MKSFHVCSLLSLATVVMLMGCNKEPSQSNTGTNVQSVPAPSALPTNPPAGQPQPPAAPTKP